MKVNDISVLEPQQIRDMRDAVEKQWAGDQDENGKSGLGGAEVISRGAETAPVSASQRGRKHGR